MKTILSVRTALLILLAVALPGTLSGPTQAKTKREPIEKLRARAFDVDRGAATTLDIVIYEWTTPEERQALIQRLVEGGSEAFYDALQAQGEKGYLKARQALGYEMRYAWQVELEGKRRITLATDRPMGFLELMHSTRSTDYNVSLVVLELDPETGEGEGSAVGGAELSIDKETGRLEIEVPGTQPTRLTGVKTRAPKKKGD